MSTSRPATTIPRPRAVPYFGLMTANEDLCADVNEVFKQLTGLGRAGKMKHVWQSPFTLHKNIIAAIRGEARLAAEGKPARIIAKMNSLLGRGIIEEPTRLPQRV